MLVLIPKGNADTREIRLLEVVWKVAEVVINTWIKSAAEFHDVLNGFRAGRGRGTAIMELKLDQELASVDQDPFFLVFLDPRKAYDNLDQGRLLKTIEGYGEGSKLWSLLAYFWSIQEVVTHQNGFHGLQLRATRGTTQEGIDSTTLFDLVVDRVVRQYMSLTMDEESATN